MTSFDAWIVAQLRSNRSVSGDDLTLVSPSLRPVADELAGLDASERDDVWRRFLADRTDREALIQAVADADPDGPRPEQTDPADDWGPIRLGTLPEADPFPVNVLPLAAANLVDEASGAIGCPPDFVAVAVLATAAGTIGRSISLRLKSDYFAASSMYVALIGPPSDGKSPALRVACSAVRKIDETLQAHHEQEMDHWRNEQETAKGYGKKAKQTAPPHPARIDIDDATMEALPSILADNPRGLIFIKDELSALMLGMNQFKGGKGSDRQFLLSAWSGKPVKIDRVKHAANIPTRVHHPCLTIIGAMTPDLIASIADPAGRDDGFPDRFLFAYPDTRPIPPWTDRGVEDATRDAWGELVARLWQRPLNVKEGHPVPHVATLAGSARDAWTEAYNRHGEEMNASGFPAKLRGPWGKLGEYAGRLVLILACLDHASDPTTDPDAIPTITPQVVRDAWRVVAYFKAHARRVHAVLKAKSGLGSDDVQALLGWIGRNGKFVFSTRDVNRNFNRFKDDEAALSDALKWLTDRNLIRPQSQTDRPQGKTGRRNSPGYEVHPTFHSSPHFRRFRQNSASEGDIVGIGGNAVESEGLL